MTIDKLHLSKEKIDINLQFYFFLKNLTKLKLTDGQALSIIEKASLLINAQQDIIYAQFISLFRTQAKTDLIKEIIARLHSSVDVELLIFSTRLTQIKALLLQEAKITNIVNASNFSDLHPLSLAYDQISVLRSYTTRVGGVLLVMLFFDSLNNNNVNLLTQNSVDFLVSIREQTKKFKKLGLEPNQIFTLSLTETINQSIISDSGANYEDRVMSILIKNGIFDITKTHEKDDKSTEFDFFFEINGRSFGIGAKRTLRERYKQFIKTSVASTIDIMIEVTLGLDLNEEKARIITEAGTYIFVADEIYKTREFLHGIDRVMSVQDMTLETFKRLK